MANTTIPKTVSRLRDLAADVRDVYWMLVDLCLPAARFTGPLTDASPRLAEPPLLGEGSPAMTAPVDRLEGDLPRTVTSSTPTHRTAVASEPAPPVDTGPPSGVREGSILFHAHPDWLFDPDCGGDHRCRNSYGEPLRAGQECYIRTRSESLRREFAARHPQFGAA